MKWVKDPPKKKGFYWVKFSGWYATPHHQGPMILEVSVDDGKVFVCEPGGDYIRTIEEYLEEDDIFLDAWSDEFILPPEEGKQDIQ